MNAKKRHERTPAILAVDDNPDNLAVLKSMLAEHLPQCALRTAANAQEALVSIAQSRPDGVLTDVQMPGMSGIQLCKKLKNAKSTAGLHVILITAQRASPDLKSEGLAAGADDFLTQPIDNVELVARIRVMLRLKRAEDGLREANEHLEETVAERTAQLTESETKHRALFAQSNDAVILHDMESRIFEVNERACGMFGYSRQKLLHMRLPELHPKNTHQDARAAGKILLKKGRVHFESQFIRSDGTVMDVDISSSVVRYTQKFVQAIIRDITARKKRAKELKCLYSISEICARNDLSLDETLRQASDAISAGWLHSKALYVRLRVDDKEFTARDSKEVVLCASRHRRTSFSSDILVKGKRLGRVEVCYDNEQLTGKAAGPFLKEEEKLLQVICEKLGSLIERKKAEDAIKAYQGQLEEKNVALKELLGQIAGEKENIQRDVLANVEGLLLPLVGRLKANGESKKSVNLLRKNIKNITSSFCREVAHKGGRLSPREVEICSMIRAGLSSKEIAGMLNTSYLTIEKQRKNIRKKLRISGKRVNLTSFLQGYGQKTRYPA